MKNILETVEKNGNCNIFMAAVRRAGLTEALGAAGPFTVFVPTDEAFAELSDESVAEMLRDRKMITTILNYHVAFGRMTTKDMSGPISARTVMGRQIFVLPEGGEVKVDGASITEADIKCSNGVIEVISSVLLPRNSPKEETVA